MEKRYLNNSVFSPAHYANGKIEVIEFIEDQNLGIHLGNAVKYIARAGKKDPSKEVEDLQKAQWYLQRQIELTQARIQGRDPVRPNQMNAPLEAVAPAKPKAPQANQHTKKK